MLAIRSSIVHAVLIDMLTRVKRCNVVLFIQAPEYFANDALKI